MGLFNLFGKRAKEQLSQENKEADKLGEFEIYSGIRVEVTTDDGNMLFVAKLLGIHENKAELHQYSETEFPQNEKPLHVRIRGYSDHNQKAFHIEGIITQKMKHIWNVDELSVVEIGNDRAFFRLSTNLDATVTMFGGLAIGEKQCKLLNISVGGACIGSKHRYHEGDKFLLKVKLIDDRPESVMYCQVLRVIEKDNAQFEYGCKFLELPEEEQEKIVQNIFAAQRKTRGSF